jgi:predicted nucleotidyltransferase
MGGKFLIGRRALASLTGLVAFCYTSRFMIPLVQEKQAEIAGLCQRLDVRRLELFGSAARGTFDSETSDLDFLYELAEGEDYHHRFFDLADGLEALFNRRVDLVNINYVRNPYLRGSIEKDREPVYAT